MQEREADGKMPFNIDINRPESLQLIYSTLCVFLYMVQSENRLALVRNSLRKALNLACLFINKRRRKNGL